MENADYEYMVAYLDYNATTPIRPEVIELIGRVLREGGNPSSQHACGRNARKYIEDAREQVANLVNYKSENVIFTSGATEGNNMVLQGHEGPIAVTDFEHPSVWNVIDGDIKIKVRPNGLIDLEDLDDVINLKNPKLISVMAVNNETGVIQPIAQIGRLCREKGILFHVDAVQAAGKIEIDFERWHCDFLSLSGHKCGAPQGVGALIFRSKTPVPKLIKGGGQERRQRAGTENTASIAGFGLAAHMAKTELSEFKRLGAFRDQIERTIEKVTGVMIHGAGTPRVYSTSCFSVPNTDAQTLMMQFDIEGICLSSGSACSSGVLKPSHVLKSMGVDDQMASSALRISMGWNTTQSDVDAFLSAWQNIKP